MPASEPEEVEEAVEHAVSLVEDGDAVLVAVDYAAREQRNLDHRFWDIHERVLEEVSSDAGE